MIAVTGGAYGRRSLPAVLDLTPDELLTTTRAVRRRLDFDRPVPPELVRECVAAALQAPSGSNNLSMQFVVVTDPSEAGGDRRDLPAGATRSTRAWTGRTSARSSRTTDAENAQQKRVQTSADFLGERMGDAPALVIACNQGARIDGLPAFVSASMLGNVLPATWNFMLAARARGLGTAWTTLHLMREREVADVVGIPYDTVQQVCLSPLAYTVGTDFKPALRPDPETIIHWDAW